MILNNENYYQTISSILIFILIICCVVIFIGCMNNNFNIQDIMNSPKNINIILFNIIFIGLVGCAFVYYLMTNSDMVSTEQNMINKKSEVLNAITGTSSTPIILQK